MSVVLETLRQNTEAIRQVGRRAQDEARRAGVPVCYIDRSAYGDDIIREYPDGRRERMIRSENGAVVPIPPRP